MEAPLLIVPEVEPRGPVPGQEVPGRRRIGRGGGAGGGGGGEDRVGLEGEPPGFLLGSQGSGLRLWRRVGEAEVEPHGSPPAAAGESCWARERRSMCPQLGLLVLRAAREEGGGRAAADDLPARIFGGVSLSPWATISGFSISFICSLFFFGGSFTCFSTAVSLLYFCRIMKLLINPVNF